MRIFFLLISLWCVSSQAMDVVKKVAEKVINHNKSKKLTRLDKALIHMSASDAPQNKIIFDSIKSEKIKKSIETHCKQPQNGNFVTFCLNALVPSSSKELIANEQRDEQNKKLYINNDVKNTILNFYCQLAHNTKYIGMIKPELYKAPFETYSLKDGKWHKNHYCKESYKSKKSGYHILLTTIDASTINQMRKNESFETEITSELQDIQKNSDVSHLIVINKGLEKFTPTPIVTINDLELFLPKLIDTSALTEKTLKKL